MRNYGIENFRFYFAEHFKFEGREKLTALKKKRLIKNSKLRICTRAKRTGFGRRAMDTLKVTIRKKAAREGLGTCGRTNRRRKMSADAWAYERPPNPSPAARYSRMVKTHQKVRLTRTSRAAAAEGANPGAILGNISKCCLKKRKSRWGLPLVVL